MAAVASSQVAFVTEALCREGIRVRACTRTYLSQQAASPDVYEQACPRTTPQLLQRQLTEDLTALS